MDLAPTPSQHAHPFTWRERTDVLAGIVTALDIPISTSTIASEEDLGRALHEAMQQDEAVAGAYVQGCSEPKPMDEIIQRKAKDLREKEREYSPRLYKLMGRIPTRLLLRVDTKVA